LKKKEGSSYRDLVEMISERGTCCHSTIVSGVYQYALSLNKEIRKKLRRQVTLGS